MVSNVFDLEKEKIMSEKLYTIPRAVYHGAGCIEAIKNLDGKRASIVCDDSMVKLGFAEKIENLLKAGGFEVQIISGVEPDPSLKTCLAGGAKMEEFNPDWIIALGGGSPMDAAKAMWVFYEYPGYDFKELTKFNIPELRKKAKLACVPTTSGTGSEITLFAVVTDTDAGIKYPLGNPTFVPDVAFIDPTLSQSMPPLLTAQTGMDALSHATEAYVSLNADDYTSSMAIYAIDMIFDNLKKAYDDGNDIAAREKMHDASAIAGMAFSNASVGIVHSMAHKLGGAFHLAHGEAITILHPYIIDYNRKSTDRYENIEKHLGVDDYAQAVRDLNKQLNFSANIKDGKNVIVKEKDFLEKLDEMSKLAFEDACTLTNPRKTSPEDIKKIYTCAFYGDKVDF